MENKILKLKRLAANKESLSSVSENAGVYVFLKGGSPVYIGKAVNLKNRLASYYSTNLSLKTAKMVSEAEEFSFIRVVTELDSLLLEAKLVHDYRPRYNINLKDDKHPLYIRITKEKYPRIITARKIEEGEKNVAFYGPFPSSQSVRSVLRMLRRIFPYADHKLGKRPCLYSHIGLCKPCPNYIEQFKDGKTKELKRKEYLGNIRNIKKVLERKTDSVIKSLHKEMGGFSKNQDFEAAAAARDRIKRLEYISQPILPTQGFLENPNLLEDLRAEELRDLKNLLTSSFLPLRSLSRIECFDVAHLAGASATASMVTFIDGEPDKNYYRHFKIRQTIRGDDISSLREVIVRRVRYLDRWGRPDLIIVDGGKGQAGAFQKILTAHKIPVVGLAKEVETLIIPKENGGFSEVRLKNSPALYLVQRLRNEAHRFARRYHHRLLKKELLGLS